MITVTFGSAVLHLITPVLYGQDMMTTLFFPPVVPELISKPYGRISCSRYTTICRIQNLRYLPLWKKHPSVPKSGLLAISSCPSVTEYFDTEQLPTKYCSGHYTRRSYHYSSDDDSEDEDSESSENQENTENSGDTEPTPETPVDVPEEVTPETPQPPADSDSGSADQTVEPTQ